MKNTSAAAAPTAILPVLFFLPLVLQRNAIVGLLLVANLCRWHLRCRHSLKVLSALF